MRRHKRHTDSGTPRPEPVNLQIDRCAMNSNVGDMSAQTDKLLTHVERGWDAHGFHHDVEAIGLAEMLLGKRA